MVNGVRAHLIITALIGLDFTNGDTGRSRRSPHSFSEDVFKIGSNVTVDGTLTLCIS